jgi:predicted outer membrane protein
MQRSMKLASLFACSLAAVAIAQDEPRREPPRPEGTSQPVVQDAAQDNQEGRQGRRGGRMVGQVQDRDFVALLQIGNRGEVEMATFVKDKLQHEKAKEFAAMMIKDHQAVLDKLNNFSGPKPGEGAVGNAKTNDPPNTTAPTPGIAVRNDGVRVNAPGVDVQLGGNRSFYAPGVNPLIQVKEEIAQECMTGAKKELEAKQGSEIDKCYIGMQIVKHADMVATLTVFHKRAQDSQFKEMLSESLAKTQQHLEMAKTIMKELEGKATD